MEYEPDTDLRDTEQIPLQEDGGIEVFLRREVLPYVADAWYQADSVKVGYEISFTRYFYKPKPIRTLAEIRADILALEQENGGAAGRDPRWWRIAGDDCMTEIIFEVTEDEVDGGYSASALGHGIHTQGESVEEIRSNVKEAVDCYFDDTMPRPKVIRLHFVRDEVLVA